MKIGGFFICLVLFKLVESLLITNAPIYLSPLSPILYHEACFAERVCLSITADGIPYVSCDDCLGDEGRSFRHSCRSSSDGIVSASADCRLLGGYCAAVADEARYVCVPAVPFNGSWWPEAVPSPTQNCRLKCGVDRAFFGSWNKTGGYERQCLCRVINNDTVQPVQQGRTMYESREVDHLLNRDPFPFCYFEQCNSLIVYGSHVSHHLNFTTVELHSRSNLLLVGFARRGKINDTECPGVDAPHIVTDKSESCWDLKSSLFLRPFSPARVLL